MANIWQPTIFINEQLASQLIEEQMGFRVDTISPLGEGFDNVAYLVNQQYVFRFPRRSMGIEYMQNEINGLAYVARHISFPGSFPMFVGVATEKYAAPFAGYPLLSGQTLCELPAKPIDDPLFAKTLATWLRELHSVPLNKEHTLLIKGDQSWRLSISERSNRVTKCLDQYENHFEHSGFQKTELLSALSVFQSYDFDQVEKTSYCHGDLYSRHIVVDKNKQPAGLIDWGDIHMGHKGTDLSVGFMIFSDDALQIFFDTYGPLDETSHRIALFRSFWHPIILLPYCYEKNHKLLKEWTTLALKKALLTIQNL